MMAGHKHEQGKCQILCFEKNTVRYFIHFLKMDFFEKQYTGGSFFLLPHLHPSVFTFLSIFTAVMTLLSHPSLFLFQLQHSSTVLQSFLSFWQSSSLSSFSSFLYAAKSFSSHIQGPIQLSLQIHWFLYSSLVLFALPVMFPCVSQINLCSCVRQFSLLSLSPVAINHNKAYINV